MENNADKEWGNPANWEHGRYIGPTVQCTECENYLSPVYFEPGDAWCTRCVDVNEELQSRGAVGTRSEGVTDW